MITVECRGEQCPIPVVKTIKAIGEMKEADTVQTHVDNETAVQNLTKLAESKGFAVKSEKIEDKHFVVTMEVTAPGAAAGAAEEPAVSCIPDRRGSTVYAFGTNVMGSGNDELGATLMKGFIYAVSQLEELPKTMLFYNGGVKLTTEGSASLEDLFSAQLECLPFDGEAVALMNEWVNENTKGMIPDIIESLDPDSAMVLINAVAFDATWEDVYEEDQVYEDDFTDAAGILSSVDTLHGTESIYMESETATAFLKPYEGGEYAFVGILPKDEDISANEFASSFTFEEYQSLWESRTDEYIVVTSIPKFDCDYTVSLTGLLGDMGITDVFTSGAADLSGISDSLDLYVSSVIQKTHIAVDEEGTEAAAATSVTLRYNGVISEVMDEIPEIKEVYLTRPFMYMIVDTETGTPVFTGTVNSL